MAKRTGSADLPLHGGRVPAWLAQRMSTLGAIITEAIVHHYGRDAFLERLSHPFWFQSFGAVMGMDSAAVQDGFDLYLHGFFVTAEGKWTVVQQGMNGDKKQARRYHWHSASVRDFVDEPHSAIDGPAQGEIINLTDHRADKARDAQLTLLAELGPDRILREFEALDTTPAAQAELPHLIMPSHHDVRPKDVFARRLYGTLAAAAEFGPVDYADLLLTPGVGTRTVRSLAMVAEVVHGTPYRFKDPARFSLAHGGKDRHPYPVPLKVYDETIRVLKSAVQSAKLGRDEELGALRRLDAQARLLESVAKGPDVDAFIAGERAVSAELDGRSVLGWERGLQESAGDKKVS